MWRQGKMANLAIHQISPSNLSVGSESSQGRLDDLHLVPKKDNDGFLGVQASSFGCVSRDREDGYYRS